MQDVDLEILDWGHLGYGEAFQGQLDLVEERINGSGPDRLVLIEHPPVVTLGRSGSHEDLCLSEAALHQRGVEFYAVDRGGQATFHGPGQLVAYPIIKLTEKDLHRYLQTLLEVVAAVIRTCGFKPVFKQGRPGVWVDSKKIASVGIAVKNWVTYHGVALNVNCNLDGFNWIVPCGNRAERITSLQALQRKPLNFTEVKEIFIKEFRKSFGYTAKPGSFQRANRRPDWLNRPAPNPDVIHQMERLLDQLQLATVCHSAHCPNLGECFNRGTATFMILGTRCTRACRFCIVDKGTPQTPDPDEPERIARAVESLNLNYVVITSVTRDDLIDGGAEQFKKTIKHVRKRCRRTRIEVLIPDFRGSIGALQTVCNAHPDVLNHNVETVARLYPVVRPGARYRRSLGILEYAAQQRVPVKSGLMLGLGESPTEITETLTDLKRAGCRCLTLGQYLTPSEHHYPVARFVSPDEFKKWSAFAHQMGFTQTAAAPLVRSSYRADEMFTKSISDLATRAFRKEVYNPKIS
jgi:lipoic acid synthetase